MFCIAAFIVLAILGIFSASHRRLAKKAWGCVVRRVTLRPCDTDFSEELRGKIIGSFIHSHPRFARFLDRRFDLLAWIFVLLSIWSLWTAALAGLNLFVYDTCTPQQAESCALGGQACSIASYTPGFVESVQTGQVIGWAQNSATQFITTLSLVPTRLKYWKPEEYLTSDNTFYNAFDAAKPVALEIVDPGCRFCAQLFKNIETADFASRYDLTYIAYPIPDPTQASGYKFKNSLLIASYLEAVKEVVPAHPKSAVAPDWQLLATVFSGSDTDGAAWQGKFDTILDDTQARAALASILTDIGYTPAQIATIVQKAASPEVAAKLQQNKAIVENKIHTVKIPTIMFDGRRYDRLIDAAALGGK